MHRQFISILSVALLLSPAAQAQSPVQVGVVDAALKVRPKESPASSSSAALTAARNEFEPFQIVVQGGQAGLSGVTATASDLTGAAGTIEARNVRMYRLGYLDLTTPSNEEGGTGLWPDPLIPDVDEVAGEKRNAFPFAVPAGENRVIFVDLHVPRETAPGVYSGRVTVQGSGMAAAELPITLSVLDFEMPATSSLPTTYGMSWNGACVAHHGSYEACGGDSGVIQSHLQYGRFMLDHRLTTELVYTGPKGSSGAWNWAGTFDPHYGPLLEGTSDGMLLGPAQLTSLRFIWTKTADRYQAWAEHFRAQGWLERTYDYTCDEPPQTCAWTDIPTRAALVHGADPELRTLVTTNIDEAKAHGVDDDIDILVPVVNHIHGRSGTYAGDQRAKYDAFLASGPRKTLWWYQSCMSHGCGGIGGPSTAGWPSFMVDATGVQNRAMQWLTYSYDISGELYYETLLELPNAWNSVYAFGGNGDGTLLYPGRPDIIGGTSHIPVASYRLKMIREGMEDYEYLKRLDDLGEGEFARAVVKSVFPNPYSTRQPVEKLKEARTLLVARLAELSGGMPEEPVPETPVPGESTEPGSPIPPAGTRPEKGTIGSTAADVIEIVGAGCSATGGGAGALVLSLVGVVAAMRRRRSNKVR